MSFQDGSFAPIRNDQGEELGVRVTVVDLTDIKAPLRAIEVLVGCLAVDLAEHDQGDVQENLQLLKSRTARLNRLLDDLLTYSRAERPVGEIREVDSAELVEGIWTMMAPPEGFELALAEDMPLITTFQAPLDQVFRNLIGNALEHHPGPQGRIRVGVEAHNLNVPGHMLKSDLGNSFLRAVSLVDHYWKVIEFPGNRSAAWSARCIRSGSRSRPARLRARFR